MTIQVISNQPKPAEPTAEPKVETPSAPASEVEQNNSSESDTKETEVKEKPEEESTSETEDNEVEDKEENSEKEKPKKKSGFQRRIEKLVAEREEERRQRQALEERLARLESGAGEKEGSAKSSPKTDLKDKPNPDDFDTHEEYLDARDEWNRKQWRAEQEQSKLTQEQEKLMSAHQGRMNAFAERNEDFADAIQGLLADGVRFSPTVDNILITSEDGPALLYELAKDLEGLKRINALPPIQAAFAIGELRAQIKSRTSASEKREPKKITNAPSPLTPIGGSSSGTPKRLEDAKSQKEYEAIRREQLKRRSPSW